MSAEWPRWLLQRMDSLSHSSGTSHRTPDVGAKSAWAVPCGDGRPDIRAELTPTGVVPGMSERPPVVEKLHFLLWCRWCDQGDLYPDPRQPGFPHLLVKRLSLVMKKVTCLFSNYTYFYMYVHSCSWYILCTRNNLYLFISFTSRSLTMSPDVLVVIVSGKRCYLDLSFKGV